MIRKKLLSLLLALVIILPMSLVSVGCETADSVYVVGSVNSTASGNTTVEGIVGIADNQSVNSTMMGLISDTELKIVRIDSSTHDLITITQAHHEIHGGRHFTYTYNDVDFDIADEFSMLIITPATDRYTHLFIDVTAALDTIVILNEDSTHTANITQTAYNNNRNSGNVAGMTINTHSNDGINGLPIFTTTFGINTGGGANKIAGGGQTRQDSEWVLKPNSKYLIVVSTATDDSTLAVILKWYEHVDRD